MPRGDGTGPMGMGAMTGRGLGLCSGVNAPLYGRGFGRGCQRGFGRGFGRGLGAGFGRGLGYGAYAGKYYGLTAPKESLQAQKEQLQLALAAIDKQLENL